MKILEEIVAFKQKEVAEKKSLYPIKLLEKSTYYSGPCVSMSKYLSDPNRSGIIAEFKRKSPSKGFINKYASVDEVTLGYMQAGASALSVLTDKHYFGARENDLETARKFNFCPILRKDFIIDPYQVVESKSMGADCILLILRILNEGSIKSLSTLALNLGMEVLYEVHDEKDIELLSALNPTLVGINNRNLQTFDVNIDRSISLAESLPKNSIKIAESGIQSVKTLHKLKENGFKGFLVGEYFMRNSDPAESCDTFIKEAGL